MNHFSTGLRLFLVGMRKRIQSHFIDVIAVTIPEISLLQKLKTGRAQ
jgi:hypothetical protein